MFKGACQLGDLAHRNIILFDQSQVNVEKVFPPRIHRLFYESRAAAGFSDDPL